MGCVKGSEDLMQSNWVWSSPEKTDEERTPGKCGKLSPGCNDLRLLFHSSF
jgi:hypothetical protein